MTSQDHATEGTCDFIGGSTCVITSLANFDGYNLWLFHMILQEYVINGLDDFLGMTPFQ